MYPPSEVKNEVPELELGDARPSTDNSQSESLPLSESGSALPPPYASLERKSGLAFPRDLEI